MSFATWYMWFGDHLYRAVLVSSVLEGFGLPIPTEVLYLPGAHLAARGEISLPLMIILAVVGNTAGGLAGYGIAYRGGPAFLKRVFRLLGIKPKAQLRMEAFFGQYGQATVFVSRFVGVIRAATLYSAGVARMSPVRFTIYLVASAVVWHGAWAFGILRFQQKALRLLHGPGQSRGILFILLLLVLLGIARYAVRWYRRRNPSAP